MQKSKDPDIGAALSGTNWKKYTQFNEEYYVLDCDVCRINDYQMIIDNQQNTIFICRSCGQVKHIG